MHLPCSIMMLWFTFYVTNLFANFHELLYRHDSELLITHGSVPVFTLDHFQWLRELNGVPGSFLVVSLTMRKNRDVGSGWIPHSAFSNDLQVDCSHGNVVGCNSSRSERYIQRMTRIHLVRIINSQTEMHPFQWDFNQIN